MNWTICRGWVSPSLAVLMLLLGGCTDAGGLLGDGGLTVPDAGPRRDAGPRQDAGPLPDSGPRFDGGDAPDADVPPPPLECPPSTDSACDCGDRNGVQICRSDGTLGCCRCPRSGEAEDLACLQQGVIGRWEGTVSTPWRPIYSVQLTLREDGAYASRCLDLDCTTFYYGADGDGEGRRYELFDLWANGSGVGRFTVVWPQSTVQWGDVDGVALSEREEHLQFDFWNSWSDGRRGPVEFDLRRIPPGP